MIKEVRRQYEPAVLNVHISWCVDVSNDVSLSDSVGRSCRRLSVGESCRVSSDGVRDSAGYGHRSILDQPCSAQRDVTHTHTQDERYDRVHDVNAADLHRHGSSADRGTSRHSGRADAIVSSVNSSSAVGEKGRLTCCHVTWVCG